MCITIVVRWLSSDRNEALWRKTVASVLTQYITKDVLRIDIDAIGDDGHQTRGVDDTAAAYDTVVWEFGVLNNEVRDNVTRVGDYD